LIAVLDTRHVSIRNKLLRFEKSQRTHLAMCELQYDVPILFPELLKVHSVAYIYVISCALSSKFTRYTAALIVR